MSIRFDDLFQDYSIHQQIGWNKFYTVTYRDQFERNSEWKRRVLKKGINLLIDVFAAFRDNKPNVMIWGDKFSRIVDEQIDSYNFFLLTNSLKIIKGIRWRKGSYPVLVYNWQRKIDKSFYTKDMKYAERSIEEIKAYLKRNRIQTVILGNDKLFIEKGIKIAAEEMNIPVVILQHGIYAADSFKLSKAADTAGYFWVWSEYVKDLYEEITGRNDVDIQVVGYPLYIDRTEKPADASVLFLGNQYYNYNEEEGNGYLQIAKTVRDICEEEGWSFTYRPHPSEKVDNRHQGFGITQGKLLQEDVNKARIVIGDVSSSMIEAAIIGRPVVQVVWSERSESAVSEPLYSFTIKCNSDKESIRAAMQEAMRMEKKSDVIDPYYMYVDDCFKTHVKERMDRLLQLAEGRMQT